MTNTFLDENAAKALAETLANDETMGWTYTAVQWSAKWWKIEVRDEVGRMVATLLDPVS